MQDTPYHREILILQSILTKLAAQNPNEDINLTYKLSEKLVSNAFSGYFEDYEKQKKTACIADVYLYASGHDCMWKQKRYTERYNNE